MTSPLAAQPSPVLLERRSANGTDSGIVTLTLNRPQARNALSLATIEAIQDALDQVAADSSVRVLIIAAAGPVFCSGHDLRELRAHPSRQNHQAIFERCSKMMLSLSRLPVPVIARVQGPATAAGCQLVASCDLAVAALSARFATPGVNIGLFCTAPMVALSRAVAPRHALEMLFAGEWVDAEAAQRMGLINRVVPDAELDDAVGELARRIAGKSRFVLATGKAAYYKQIDMDREAAYAFANGVMADNMMAPDAREGIDAFLEKRSPHWEDR